MGSDEQIQAIDDRYGRRPRVAETGPAPPKTGFTLVEVIAAAVVLASISLVSSALPVGVLRAL